MRNSEQTFARPYASAYSMASSPALFDFRISTFLFPLLPPLLPLQPDSDAALPGCRPLMCADAAAVARFICRMYVCDRESERRAPQQHCRQPDFSVTSPAKSSLSTFSREGLTVIGLSGLSLYNGKRLHFRMFNPAESLSVSVHSVQLIRQKKEANKERNNTSMSEIIFGRCDHVIPWRPLQWIRCSTVPILFHQAITHFHHGDRGCANFEI